MPVNLSGEHCCCYTGLYTLTFGTNAEQMYFYITSHSALLVDLASRKSLGTEKVWERILKIVWDVCEKGSGRVQAWE